MTPKASPLSNRGYYCVAEAPPASCYAVTSTLKGCPTFGMLSALLFTPYSLLSQNTLSSDSCSPTGEKLLPQFSIINNQLSTINCQQSIVNWIFTFS